MKYLLVLIIAFASLSLSAQCVFVPCDNIDFLRGEYTDGDGLTVSIDDTTMTFTMKGRNPEMKVIIFEETKVCEKIELFNSYLNTGGYVWKFVYSRNTKYISMFNENNALTLLKKLK